MFALTWTELLIRWTGIKDFVNLDQLVGRQLLCNYTVLTLHSVEHELASLVNHKYIHSYLMSNGKVWGNFYSFITPLSCHTTKHFWYQFMRIFKGFLVMQIWLSLLIVLACYCQFKKVQINVYIIHSLGIVSVSLNP